MVRILGKSCTLDHYEICSKIIRKIEIFSFISSIKKGTELRLEMLNWFSIFKNFGIKTEIPIKTESEYV